MSVDAVTNWSFAWSNTERRCREYLRRVLGSVEGWSDFDPDDMPAGVPTDESQWFGIQCRLNGGNQVAHRQNRDEIVHGVWIMDGEIRLWTPTDAGAKLLLGAIWNALPATEADIDGISRFYPTAYPSRDWVSMRVLSDTRVGDERRLVLGQIPVACAFFNTPRAT